MDFNNFYSFKNEVCTLEFFYFKNCHSVFLKRVSGDWEIYLEALLYSITNNVKKLKCIVIENNNQNSSIVIESNFISTNLISENKNEFYYLGNKNFLFDCLYNYYESVYKECPFDNIVFLKVIDSVNHSTTFKTDSLFSF